MTKLRCWSCRHYERDRCLASRKDMWQRDAGNQCSAFDYEPGSDDPQGRGEWTPSRLKNETASPGGS